MGGAGVEGRGTGLARGGGGRPVSAAHSVRRSAHALWAMPARTRCARTVGAAQMKAGKPGGAMMVLALMPTAL